MNSLVISNPIRLVEMAKAFYIGGTEVQVLELLRSLPATYERNVAVLDEEGPLLEDVFREGLLPKAFPLGSSFLSAQALFQVGRMAHWLSEKQIQLVHAHDFYSTLLAVPACRLAHVPIVVSRLDLLHWHGPQRAMALKWLTRQAQHVIANADAIRHYLVHEEGLPAERVSVIRNGIQLNRFDERRLARLTADIPETHGLPIVTHIANMGHEVKRQEDLIAALTIVLKQFGPAHLFFVGDGDRKPLLKKMADDLGLSKYTHFLGFRKDGPAILARSTLGVLCSENEGLSNAVMEGMAASVPMVVTNVGGNPELIEHRKRGLVVPKRNPQALAEAIIELLRKPEMATQMGKAARSFVEEELTLAQMVAAHDVAYQRTLARWH